MIDDLDNTVEKLLRRELPASLLGQVAITFATPDQHFPPSTVVLPTPPLPVNNRMRLKRPLPS